MFSLFLTKDPISTFLCCTKPYIFYCLHFTHYAFIERVLITSKIELEPIPTEPESGLLSRTEPDLSDFYLIEPEPNPKSKIF